MAKKGNLFSAHSKASESVVYPVVVVEVGGIRCRELLDTGAGSLYASSILLDEIKARPHETQTRTIEMMLGAQTKKLELYSVKVDSVETSFSLKVEVTRVEKENLL